MVRGNTDSMRDLIKKQFKTKDGDSVSLYDNFDEKQKEKFDLGYDDIGMVRVGRLCECLDDMEMDMEVDNLIHRCVSEIEFKFYELITFIANNETSGYVLID